MKLRLSQSALVLGFFLMSSRLDAQLYEAPQHVSDGKLLIVNSVIGATTAGIYRVLSHKPIAPGVLRGAIGGAGVYAGKRLIGNGRPGYWWLGREVSSISSAEIANAGLGLKPLEEIVLPVGPIRLHFDRTSRKLVPRLDVASTIGAVVVGARQGNRFAWRESVSTGAIVFLTPETSDQIGSYAAGVLSVSELAPDGHFEPLESKRSILSHEMTHAAQYDFTFNSLSAPIRGVVESKNPRLKRSARYFDANLMLPVEMLLNSFMSYQDRPWEREAVSIARHAP